MTEKNIQNDSTDTKEKEDTVDRLLLVSGVIGFIVVLTVATAAAILYAGEFEDGTGLSKSQEVWGQFGDFMGGLLNPAIGAVTIYLVLVSVYLQRKELRNSISEMKTSNNALETQINETKRQSFEQTFFTWLNSYRQLVDSIRGLIEGKEYFGRQALYETWNDSLSASSGKFAALLMSSGLPSGEPYRAFQAAAHAVPEHVPIIKQAILKSWERIYQKQQHQIDSVFRTLFRLLMWIDEQPKDLIGEDEKWRYVSIVRAQVSQIELFYLYYNGHTRRGAKFVALINKYAFFDNLRSNDSGLIFLKNNTTVYSETAFNTDRARGRPVDEYNDDSF